MTPQCTGKIRYATAPAAYRMLRRRTARQHDGVAHRTKRRYPAYHIYRCGTCRGGWHVGTNFEAG